MRQPTNQELRVLEETLDWIRPIIDLEYVYVEEDNAILIGDNYIIRGGFRNLGYGDAKQNTFNLIYGENHPGDDFFNLARWEEEDIATSTNLVSLIPIFVASLFQRLSEDKIYSNIVLAKLVN